MCLCPDDHTDRLAHRNQLLLRGGRPELLREESGVGSGQTEGGGVFEEMLDLCGASLMRSGRLM